jgi:hypothetical protein
MEGVMYSFTRQAMQAIRVALLPVTVLLGACGDEGYDGFTPTAETGQAFQYGIWTPGPNDTCTKDKHDSYYVIGPDGKRYNTWHPPVDPSGCTFGHEHGRDPRGSKLYGRTGPIPFGLANEALETWDPANVRHEDHFGHKIDWENNIEFVRREGVTGALFSVKCSVLAKLHQGTHSKDAFTNNLHEIVYHLECSDQTEMHVTILTAIGTPGEFHRSCDLTTIVVGPATPANSPNGGGQRRIPDRFCVEQFMKVPAGQNSDFSRALHENWETSNAIRTENGRTIASFNPYFQVFSPSRFYDPDAPNITGRPIDVCYETGSETAHGSMCDQSTNNGATLGVTYDNPLSRFNGVRRFIDINDNNLDNEDGPTVWYTDPFGRHASKESFPGSIKQWVAKVKNDYGFSVNGPVIGDQRNYGAASVHAPN